MASFKSHPIVNSALVVVLLAGFGAVTWGVEFAGGTGEPNDPYQIATAGQLIGMGQDPSLYAGYFVLVADIDLDPNLPGGQVFSRSLIAPYGLQPRASSGKLPYGSFEGVFDGNGHVIRNMVIRAENESMAGLFGYVGLAGRIEDLGLEGVDIRRSSLEEPTFTGGSLVAVNQGGTVLRCYARGTVTGPERIGGPTGTSTGGGKIRAAAGNDEIGGLIGANGGLVNACYALVDVCGTGAIGGLIGQNNTGMVFFSFSAGRVQGTGWPGGLIGGTTVTGYTHGRAFVQSDAGTVIRCYWDMETSGMLDSAAGDGRTTAELMSRQTYTPWAHTGVWLLDDANDYPRLLWEQMPGARIGTGQFGYGGGSGDPNDPYEIQTAEQFLTIGCHPEDFQSSFVLTADLDFNDVEHSRFLPIGFECVSFNGQFDGQSHSLSNLRISQPRATGVGVFGLVGNKSLSARYEEFHYEIRDHGLYSWGFSGGGNAEPMVSSTIKSLHLRSVSVTGQQDVGGLIGVGAATVTDCSVTGQVTGMAMVGGLVGCSQGGTLSHCRADVQVSGEFGVGGLVGFTRPSVRSPAPVGGKPALNVFDCRTSGTVTGQLFTGGLLGYSPNDAVSGCAALAQVHGRYNAGGCLGSTSSSFVTLSYCLGAVAGERSVGGFAGEAGAATIDDSYCLADVTGGVMVGGFAGHTGSKGRVARCYAVSRVTAIDVGAPSPFVGGFAGVASKADSTCVGDCPISIFDCFWDTDISGLTEALGNRPSEPANTTGLTTAQMQTASPFLAAGWDFADVWTICEGEDYPRLRWEEVECGAGQGL